VLARRAHKIDRSGQGWIVCRVPVAVQIATGDDARSLRLPGHLPHGAGEEIRCVEGGGYGEAKSPPPSPPKA